MSAPESLIRMIGDWVGTNRLWLSSEEPARQSASTAYVELIALGQFITIRYTWAEGSTAQDGCLLLGQSTANRRVHAVWVDSWHMQDQLMLCQGEVREEGEISIQGSYAASPGPDWGWRILIAAKDTNMWFMNMYNLSPDGEEALAVEAVFTRQSE